MHDLNLYQVLYALTRITGDDKYKAAANDALSWFFNHCQSKPHPILTEVTDRIELDWPDNWHIFGPLPAGSGPLPPRDLQRIPSEIRVGEKTYRPIPFKPVEFTIDLAYPLGGYGFEPLPADEKPDRWRRKPPQEDTDTEGNVAYLFAAFQASADGKLLVGAGANHSMEWFLDGEKLFKAPKTEMGRKGAFVLDHVFSFPVTKGNHVLAVRLVAGRTGWVFSSLSAKALENVLKQGTDLLAWGEHLSWDFRWEAPISGGGGHGSYRERIHEFYRPWLLWKRSFELAPEPCTRFARGLWEHQIHDQKTGDFSRHANFDWHRTDDGSQFPRHGGFYIDTWAWAYEKSKDAVFLKAISVLVESFEARRTKDWGRFVPAGAIPMQTRKPGIYEATSNLSLAIDLDRAASRVPPELARTMRRCAKTIDEIYLRKSEDVWRLFAKEGHVRTYWRDGYGGSGHTFAKEAMLCLLRFRQTGNAGYRKRVLTWADEYLDQPPAAEDLLSPGVLGDAILLEIAAFRMTGDEKYLERAARFGRFAVRTFFDHPSALPRATTKHDHYEAIMRADTLAMGLLELWVAKTKPELDLKMMYSDR